MRLRPSQTTGVVVALGTAQTVAFASTYYIPAVLAVPMARDLGLSPLWVYTAFSLALITSALVGPFAGRRIDLLGGRTLLIASTILFALGLVLLAVAREAVGLFAAWLVIGIGMGCGLYEAAFATLAAIYGAKARPSITGITLIAGFASTVGWPLSAVMEAEWGWRGACLGWAAINILISLPLYAALPHGVQPKPLQDAAASGESAKPPVLTLALLAYVFAVTLFCSTSLATHLPRLLESAGATPAAAIAAGALIGPAQVGARLIEFGFLRHHHPLILARVAIMTHPLAVAVLMLIGAPAAYAFTLLHGAGNGVMTIAKGTLPLALFGPAGYGLRQGLLNAPGRILQAFAPVIFGFALESYGANAVWLTGGLGLTAFAALLVLRRQRPG
jgi:predicted MFS family arabinose efflux permease